MSVRCGTMHASMLQCIPNMLQTCTVFAVGDLHLWFRRAGILMQKGVFNWNAITIYRLTVRIIVGFWFPISTWQLFSSYRYWPQIATCNSDGFNFKSLSTTVKFIHVTNQTIVFRRFVFTYIAS